MNIFIIVAFLVVSFFIGYGKGIDKERKRQETIDKLVEVYRIMEERKKKQQDNESNKISRQD